MPTNQKPRAIAALAVCFLVLAACATARSDARIPAPVEDPGWQPALSSVYARMAASMSRPDQIYTPTMSALDTQGEIVFTTTTDAWLDVANGRARADIAASFSPDNIKRAQWTVNGRAYFQTLEYDPTFKREAVTCRGADWPLVAILLACRGADEAATTVAIPDSDYHGAEAVALITTGTAATSQQRNVFTDTLFLDPETYLPIALEGSGRVEALDATGEVTSVQPTGLLIRYEHDFVDASSIDEEFFDPASLGYEEPDPVAAITKPSPDFTAYWLGPNIAFDDLPPLTIRDAFVISGANRPELRYRATVTYRAIDDEFSPPLLELQQWRSDEWSQFEGFLMSAWREDVCVDKIELTGKAWSATLFAGFSADLRDSADVPCPDTDANRYIATVDLGSTFVRITAPEGSPFNREEAMREVIKALEPAN